MRASKGDFARIDITCTAADAEKLQEVMKGELGRRVFYFLEAELEGPIQVHLEIKVNDIHSERIWARE